MKGSFSGLAVLLLFACALAAPTKTHAATVEQQGYIELPDGVGLKYKVEMPEGGGPFPVLLQYQGYGAGTDPSDNGLGLIVPRLLENGFAILGVNLRGSGCSEGRFDLFEQQWVEDGLVVIDWASRQSWSNGSVGMVGESFPGITQLMVGPRRPPALKALLPWSAMTDLYRDVAYPGGIFNASFAAGWTGLQKTGTAGMPDRVLAGDTRCALALPGQNDPERIVFLMGQSQPWADDAIYGRVVLDDTLAGIGVPTLVAHSWQDEQLSSRVTLAYEKLDPRQTWHIYGNGQHLFGLLSADVRDAAEAFLLHFMKGVNNGFERTPHVQIQHEVAYGQGPRWVTSHPQWPPATRLAELYFTPQSTLDSTRPQSEARFDYAYPLPAPSMTAAAVPANENQTYQLPVPPGGAAVFTSPALAHDLELLGPARVDLWLSSTATDTDIQVSLTEVRPDGQEMFVQRGWLRASHRPMDLRRTRPAVPFHPHTAAEAVPLVIGEPTPLSIEVWPVGHVFRQGSSLRVSIEAPVGTTGFRQLEINPAPAVNTIHVGGSAPSRITLTLVPGGRAQAPAGDCSGLINQPCRASASPQPMGELVVPAAVATSRPAAGAAHGTPGGARLVNAARATHYVRAITLRLPNAQDLEEVAVSVGDRSVTVRDPLPLTRIELPEFALAPNTAVELPVTARGRSVSVAASLANEAHAGAGTPVRGAPYAPLAWLLALLLLSRRRMRATGWAIVLLGTLVACGSGGALDGRSAGASGWDLESVELVDDRGTFVGYEIQRGQR